MRRWETLTALGSVVCASLATIHFPLHWVLTYVALAMIGVVGVAQLQRALRSRGQRSDAEERARRIREARGGGPRR